MLKLLSEGADAQYQRNLSQDRFSGVHLCGQSFVRGWSKRRIEGYSRHETGAGCYPHRTNPRAIRRFADPHWLSDVTRLACQKPLGFSRAGGHPRRNVGIQGGVDFLAFVIAQRPAVLAFVEHEECKNRSVSMPGVGRRRR